MMCNLAPDILDRGKPMSTAPKDRPILAWCDHEADSEYEPDGKRLTLYAAHREGLSNVGTGFRVIVWGGGFYDSEEDGGAHLPDWWFLDDGNFETAANPTAWWDLPVRTGSANQDNGIIDND